MTTTCTKSTRNVVGTATDWYLIRKDDKWLDRARNAERNVAKAASESWNATSTSSDLRLPGPRAPAALVDKWLRPSDSQRRHAAPGCATEDADNARRRPPAASSGSRRASLDPAS